MRKASSRTDGFHASKSGNPFFLAELKLNPTCASAGSELCLGWQSEIFSSAKPIQFPCHIKENCMNTALRPQALSTIVVISPVWLPPFRNISLFGIFLLPHCRTRRNTLGFPTCILCVDRRRPLQWGSREKRHETLRGDRGDMTIKNNGIYHTYNRYTEQQ